MSQFKTASQLLNPVSLLKFDAVEIRSSKEGKRSHGAGQGSGERFEFLMPLLLFSQMMFGFLKCLNWSFKNFSNNFLISKCNPMCLSISQLTFGL